MSRHIWQEIHVLAEGFRDLDDRVLLLGRLQGRGRGSGVQVDAPPGFISDFQDRRITRTRAYLGHAGALHAAGLTS